MQLLKQSKEKITARLDYYLKQKAEEFKEYGYSQDIYDKLFPFSTNGKMVRGSLFLQSCELFWNRTEDELLDIACAIELLHTGFLIQDDIMDKDVKRRGLDCIHIQYRSESLAMCLADLAFFFSFELIQKHPIVLPFMTSMMTRTGLGQMMDVQPESLTHDGVIQVYEAKTAYYTFYLPLGLAGLICTSKVPDDFLELSKKLGVIFQITDDILGYEGDPTKTGKGVGTDIEQRKYTLYISHLLEVSNPEDRSVIEAIYLHAHITPKDIERIHMLYEKYNVGSYLKQQIEENNLEIKKILDKSSYEVKGKKFIEQLMEYIISRCS